MLTGMPPFMISPRGLYASLILSIPVSTSFPLNISMACFSGEMVFNQASILSGSRSMTRASPSDTTLNSSGISKWSIPSGTNVTVPQPF